MDAAGKDASVFGTYFREEERVAKARGDPETAQWYKSQASQEEAYLPDQRKAVDLTRSDSEDESPKRRPRFSPGDEHRRAPRWRRSPSYDRPRYSRSPSHGRRRRYSRSPSYERSSYRWPSEDSYGGRSGYRGRSPPPYRRYYADELRRQFERSPPRRRDERLLSPRRDWEDSRLRDDVDDTASVPVSSVDKTEDEDVEDLMRFFHRESERTARACGDLDGARFHADLAAGMSHQEVLARARARAATRSQRRLGAFFKSRQGRRGV